MNRVEKHVMDRWRRNAALTAVFGLVFLVCGVWGWATPVEEGFSVALNVVMVVVSIVAGLFFIGVSHYGAYSVGVIQGRRGWDDLGEVGSFEEQVGRKRTEIQEKLR